MFDKFVWKNWLKIVHTVFEDYLWTQFFPSLKLANDTFIKDKFSEIYWKISTNDNLNNLYIHLPFCKTRCTYCHCYTSLDWEDSYEEYISYLLLEIDQVTSKIWKKIKLDSIFIWGWTPNIIWYKLLDRLLTKINNNFDLSGIKQYNIDLNPYFLDNNTIITLSKHWVNRCTYAIQSFNKEVLRKNSRFYDENTNHIENVRNLKLNWIHVNIDLMVWISAQTLEICVWDIEYARELKADNISLNYFIQSSNVHYKIDDEKIKLINDVKSYYNNYIYKTYNTDSNFQEDNYLSNKVNLIWIWNGSISHIYWEMICYNIWNLKDYYSDINNNEWNNKKIKYLSLKDEMIKFIWLNLIYKIDRNKFIELFGTDILNVFKDEMNYLESKKLIYISDNYIEPKVSNFKLYLYLSILLKDYLEWSELNDNKVFLKENIKRFFLKNWEKVDEDY